MEYVDHSSNCRLRIILVTTLTDYSSFVSNLNYVLYITVLSSAFVKKTSHLNRWCGINWSSWGLLGCDAVYCYIRIPTFQKQWSTCIIHYIILYVNQESDQC